MLYFLMLASNEEAVGFSDAQFTILHSLLELLQRLDSRILPHITPMSESGLSNIEELDKSLRQLKLTQRMKLTGTSCD